jgi:hypothetical protein
LASKGVTYDSTGDDSGRILATFLDCKPMGRIRGTPIVRDPGIVGIREMGIAFRGSRPFDPVVFL